MRKKEEGREKENERKSESKRERVIDRKSEIEREQLRRRILKKIEG